MQYVIIFMLFLGLIFSGCTMPSQKHQKTPDLKVSSNNRYFINQNNEPFLWLGGTVWGMSEWLSREEVVYYLDDRKSKGFNVVQICLFWGKRHDDPIRFHLNPTNYYGHKAFTETDGKPDPYRPDVKEGGTPENPNDYWDHVDYILKAAAQRNMHIGLLPVWGRRYVNATHPGFSHSVFDKKAMQYYGEFLGDRYGSYDHIIWILGGDVPADAGGDFREHYRAMAEGIISGTSGKKIAWNENSKLWDQVLMTYHPDGSPFKNSSTWFHDDPWLDFNMIETFINVNDVYDAVKIDYALIEPVKPTIMGEPGYELWGLSTEKLPDSSEYISSLQVRRQAWQSMFAGAAGFTYGAHRDSLGNGPLFSPFNDWKKLLDLEGARSMIQMKNFCMENEWPDWKPVQDFIEDNTEKGELHKVGVEIGNDSKWIVYFPDNSQTEISFTGLNNDNKDSVFVQWFNPVTGRYDKGRKIKLNNNILTISPPEVWMDAVAILYF